ncbi:DUF6879 family protein [Nocardia tengchongensis]|uniref:DUF6879 family protein n=1 Tax=Nocardia tengchongensis TaxID=2055889 RepID=UPI0036C658D9
MQLVQGEAFDDLFRKAKTDAFHLEVQDSYETPEESEPFRRFLDGQTDDYDWLQGWLGLVSETTSRGVRVQRARVVTLPHSDYVRWSLTVSAENTQAGEEIRYLPRHLIDSDALTADDWWLFDDQMLGFTIFEPGGRWAGAAVTTDPHIVSYARRVREQVWAAATPWLEYARQ